MADLKSQLKNIKIEEKKPEVKKASEPEQAPQVDECLSCSVPTGKGKFFCVECEEYAVNSVRPGIYE
jgi:hypothetical protein